MSSNQLYGDLPYNSINPDAGRRPTRQGPSVMVQGARGLDAFLPKSHALLRKECATRRSSSAAEENIFRGRDVQGNAMCRSCEAPWPSASSVQDQGTSQSVDRSGNCRSAEFHT